MLQEIHLDQLKPSPTNPRKTFDDAKLVDLARSIEEVGVLEPLIVRPYPDPNPNTRAMNGHRYEIVAGERRYRAARVTATVATVPCIVRDLNDVQVLEIQTIENLQRDDVHPLEEAEGYAALMKATGYDADRIAEKIGKSRAYVYDRIKLLQLIPELKKAFIDGEITAGHAILLARLSPDEQRQVLGVDGDEDEGYEDGWHRGGLFKADHGSPDPVLELDVPDELEDDARKAVSVRELETYIREHVRFRPEAIDLPNLFPETAAALELATTRDVKVVHITYEYRVADSARDEQRTYGQQAWKRADGEEDRGPYDSKSKKSKTCEHSVLGLVVAGPGRGQAFAVCVRKDKCKVHWAAEIKASEQRAKERGTGKSASSKAKAERKPSWQVRQEKEDAERERWKPAMREIAEAAVEAIKTADPLKLFDLIDEGIAPWGRKKPRTTGTLEERIRALVGLLTGDRLDKQYPSPERITPWLKTLGVDAVKIVDRVSPKVKKAAKEKAEASNEAKAKKPGARARRRSKKTAKA